LASTTAGARAFLRHGRAGLRQQGDNRGSSVSRSANTRLRRPRQLCPLPDRLYHVRRPRRGVGQCSGARATARFPLSRRTSAHAETNRSIPPRSRLRLKCWRDASGPARCLLRSRCAWLVGHVSSEQGVSPSDSSHGTRITLSQAVFITPTQGARIAATSP
jgi:hypothetical protein